jgi:hypothetical protein
MAKFHVLEAANFRNMSRPCLLDNLIWIKRVVAYEYEFIYISRGVLQFGLESELHKREGYFNSSKLKRITLTKHLPLETTNQLNW